MEIEQIIKNIEINYITLPAECKRELKQMSKVLTIQKEAKLVNAGEFATKTYFIAAGSARAYYLKEGRDISDWFAFENDFISSINSFFLNIASPHFIEVLEPSTLLEISKETVLLLSDKYNAFDRLGKLVVTKTMLQQQQRIASIQFENALQKYENVLKIRPDILQRVPLTHIASYLGITLETLSRIRSPKKRI